MSYPQHEKLSEIRDKSQAIGEFIEWASDRGWELAEWVTFGAGDGFPFERMVPVNRPIPALLAEYFGIDLAELEREKRAMLTALRGES